MNRRALRITVSMLLAAGLPGCAALLHPPRARPAEAQCVLVNATFREASGGVGREFVEMDGQHMANSTFYTACPTDNHIPSDIKKQWAAVWNDPRFSKGAPYHSEELNTWTEPHNGVLYKYSKHAIYFHNCDFWFSLNDECTPANGVKSVSNDAPASESADAPAKQADKGDAAASDEAPPSAAKSTHASAKPTAAPFDVEAELSSIDDKAPAACKRYAKIQCSRDLPKGTDRKVACDGTIKTVNQLVKRPNANKACATMEKNAKG
jgi:hypothetical protein